MKLSTSLLVLSVSVLSALLIPPVSMAQTTSASTTIAGVWQGLATVRGQQVPLTLNISVDTTLRVAFLNGPASHPDMAPASSVTLDGNHLVASFDYFARVLDATLAGSTLAGTYGPANPNGKGAPPTPFTLTRVVQAADPAAAASAPDISGSWEIATKSAKGENAWKFRVDPHTGQSPLIKAVIQRIDGDTGGLWGTWDGTGFRLSHFNAAGPALYSVTPQSDGTLLIKSLLAAGRSPTPPDLVARRTSSPAGPRKPAS